MRTAASGSTSLHLASKHSHTTIANVQSRKVLLAQVHRLGSVGLGGGQKRSWQFGNSERLKSAVAEAQSQRAYSLYGAHALRKHKTKTNYLYKCCLLFITGRRLASNGRETTRNFDNGQIQGIVCKKRLVQWHAKLEHVKRKKRGCKTSNLVQGYLLA